MKKVGMATLMALCVLSLNALAAIKTWDGGASTASWSDASNWNNNTVPGSADTVLLDNSSVAGSYNVTLPGGAVSTSVRKLTISPTLGNKITVTLPSSSTASPYGFRAGDGTAGTDDIIIDRGGILVNASTAASGYGVEASAPANGTVRINNGGRYVHKTSCSTVGVLTGLSTAAGTETGEFGYDSPGTDTVAIDLGNYGSLTLIRSDGPATYTTAGSTTFTIRGDFRIDSDVTYSSTINGQMWLYGDLTNDGAALTLPSTTEVMFWDTTAIGGTGSITFAGTFNVTNSGVVTLGRDIALTKSSNTVSGKLYCQGYAVGGTGGFSLSNAATIGIGHADGLNGNIAVSGARTFATTANYLYNGTSPQVTGSYLPTSVNDLRIDNGSGVTLSKNVYVFGVLTLSNGQLITGSDSIRISGNNIIRTSGSVYGTLGMWINTGTGVVKLIPLSTASGYSPVSVAFGAVTGPADLWATAVEASQPDVVDAANTLQRYWSFNSWATFDSCAMTFAYLPGDFTAGFAENPDENAMVVGKHDGSGWTFPSIGARTPGGAADGGTIQATGLTSFSDFTMGKDGAAIHGNMMPVISVVQAPSDTYDGTGPFTVRAVITDPVKNGIAADTMWYTNNVNWWAITHSTVSADTYLYTIPGPIASGTVIEYFFGAWDDAGAASYLPSQYKGRQFRILEPLAPAGLTATPGNNSVQLDWTPPRDTLRYDGTPTYGWPWGSGNIVSTRFTPQHYPCRIEQAHSMWSDNAGMDSVEVHVWPDDGNGVPDTMTELVPPFKVLPVSMSMKIINLSGFNVVLGSGDFHVGYVCQSANRPYVVVDAGGGTGLHSLFFDGSAWGNIVSGGVYYDLSHRAVVSYSSYTKGPGKSVDGYQIWRNTVSGSYFLTGFATDTVYHDNSLVNDTTYYYVVRSAYADPTAYSEWSNEASATPSGVAGGPADGLPLSFAMGRASPNPAFRAARLSYQLPGPARVRLEIYNIAGQRVTTLVDEQQPAGYYAPAWDLSDDGGRRVGGGVYFFRLSAGTHRAVGKLTVIK